MAKTKGRKIRWWLIALGVLTFVGSFATPWTLEVVGLYGTTLRMGLVLVGVLFIIAAFPGYQFLLKWRRYGWRLEDWDSDDDDD